MKIHNGFISNSSSSSFIAAFPKKPKTINDVSKYMFNGEDGKISVYDQVGLSYAKIATNVFNDLKHNSFKKATLKAIVEEFEGHYHYYSQGNVFWSGRINDEMGGAWVERIGRYFGSDMEIMDKIRKHIIEREEQDKKDKEREKEIIAKSGLKEPKYAYQGGIDYRTKKSYTKKEIKDHDSYMEALEKFKTTNPEYIEFIKTKNMLWRKERDAFHNLVLTMATKDAQNFLDDNKGKFVFIISYSDNKGETGRTMEHGNIFRNVPHVTKNNH
jgi:hypothetical protein